MDAVVTTLRTVSLFAELPREVLARLVREFDARDVPAGHTVFARGDPGDALHVVASGAVEVRGERGGQGQRGPPSWGPGTPGADGPGHGRPALGHGRRAVADAAPQARHGALPGALGDLGPAKGSLLVRIGWPDAVASLPERAFSAHRLDRGVRDRLLPSLPD
jgi:hypothetical protein